MKTSEVLKQAKQHLTLCGDPGEYRRADPTVSHFICVALELACTHGDISEDDCDNAQHMIHCRLGVHYTLEVWLREKHGISIYNCGTTLLARQLFRDKVQATRHAWVDSMIAEFAALGD